MIVPTFSKQFIYTFGCIVFLAFGSYLYILGYKSGYGKHDMTPPKVVEVEKEKEVVVYLDRVQVVEKEVIKWRTIKEKKPDGTVIETQETTQEKEATSEKTESKEVTSISQKISNNSGPDYLVGISSTRSRAYNLTIGYYLFNSIAVTASINKELIPMVGITTNW